MPSTYEQTVANLGADAANRIEKACAAWSADWQFSQIRQNIRGETALSAADFESLLNAFFEQLNGGASGTDAWIKACHAHQFRGQQIPSAHCPATLGRAKNLDDHSAAIARASGYALTKVAAKALLLKYAGEPIATAFDRFLRDTPLGDYVVWATFCEVEPGVDPFDRLPQTHRAICTALGLGHLSLTDTLITLTWGHTASGSPPLHRPTVADACSYAYYRPYADPNTPWGFTCPLAPNVDALKPQPEVVMPTTSSIGLRLPFRVLHS